MAKSLNKVTLIGHIGKDPETRYSGSGMQIVSFSMATNDMRKDKASGQLQEHAEWHNIVAFDKLAGIIGQYVKKGSRIYLEGRIQTRTYDDKEGNKRYITEIVANDMIMLDGAGNANRGDQSNSRSQASANSTPAPAQAEYEPAHEAPVDDLPF